MPGGSRPARVIGRTALSPRVTELTLALEGDEPFRFLPGQHVRLRPDVPGGEDSFFSIAASPERAGQRTLLLAVTNASELLGQAAPGSAILVDGPFGELTWRPAPGALLVGAGTGVTPLRAIAFGALAAGETVPSALVAGNRTRGDLLWHEELGALQKRHPHFRYEPVLSLADPAWAGRQGHVQDHLPAVAAELPAGFRAYLCGSSRMVEDCRRVLEALGVTAERILSEADA